MAGGISVHAVDVSHGRPAQGLRVDIYALAGVRKLIASGKLAANGAMDDPVARGDVVVAGTYEVVFHVGDYLKSVGAPTSTPPFLDTVPFRFTIADAAQHYHLPFKFTPWGFSLFRGN
ncbi:MAG: 5-hydroxyisourate hydrolase [Hyphomicrobiales bacterium]|jgi:5-hydroxyisourate hydrolase|nr:5-hydroxyisourate hydrolase [Hyphomicrobiales bacterium]